MENRVLQPRKAKLTAKESIHIQPAKRVKRAQSCMERAPKAAERVFNIAHVSSSTQTENCLVATNAELTRQLIAANSLLQQKDQKYIEMLQKFYLLKEKLLDENRMLKERVQSLETEPLVQVAVNGKLNTHIDFFRRF